MELVATAADIVSTDGVGHSTHPVDVRQGMRRKRAVERHGSDGRLASFGCMASPRGKCRIDKAGCCPLARVIDLKSRREVR